MAPLNKITLTSVLVAIGIVICLWLLFGRGCAGPSHKADTKQVKEIVRTVHVMDVVDQLKYDSLNVVVAKQAAAIDSIARVKAVVQGQLNNSKIRINSLVAAGRMVIIRSDSGAFYANCDSLAVEAQTLIRAEQQQEENNRALQAGYENQLNNKDSIIAKHVEQYAMIRQSFDQVADKYGSLNKDYVKANRQVKVQRTFVRVLAGVVVVLAGTMILSK